MHIIHTVFIRTVALFLIIFRPPDKVRDFLLWPIASRVLGLGYEKAVTMKNGVKIRADMKDMLNRLLIFYGPYVEYLWEPQTFKLLQCRMEGKNNILVAGSHIGYMVLMAAHYSSPDSRIFTFEPISYLNAISSFNFKLNPNLEPRIVLEKYALGDKNGKASMYIEDLRSSFVPYSNAHRVHNNTEEVEIMTLDAYIAKKAIKPFGMLLLDVEGYELFVLKGAEKSHLSGSSMPDLIIEVSLKVLKSTSIAPNDIYSFLRSKGYSIYIIKDNYDSNHVGRNDRQKLDIVPLKEGNNDAMAGHYFNIFATTDSKFHV